jgi:hypothetical protein
MSSLEWLQAAYAAALTEDYERGVTTHEIVNNWHLIPHASGRT